MTTIEEQVPGLGVAIEGPLYCLDRSSWDVLFSGHSDSYDNIVLTQQRGMDGITFRTLIVRDSAGPVLVLPTFQAMFDASTMADGKAGSLVRRLAPFAPGLFRPQLLGVGLLDCERAAIGTRPDVDVGALRHAWRLAFQSLGATARLIGASATVFLDISPADLARIPPALLQNFASVPTFPCGRVPIRFDSVEHYIAGLSRSTRQGLRRKLRGATAIQIERTSDIRPHLDRVVALYRSTVERASLVLGVQRPEYFRDIGSCVPGAEYVLYSLNGRLLAFNLLIEHRDMLIDKYFCMEAEAGRAHNLYFLSWVENNRHAIARGLAVYHAGPGCGDT
jgi:hypothetical protein